jgi:ABC-type multidrug transport system ATPase subunit
MDLSQDPKRAVVHVTQFPDEVALSSRVVVLDEGAVVFDGTPSELFDDSTELERWGLRRPGLMRLASRLRECGYAVPKGASTLGELVEAVAGGLDGGIA